MQMKTVIGVDVGEYQIKVVLCEVRKEVLVIKKVETVIRPLDIQTESDDYTKIVWVKEQLDEFIKVNKVKFAHIYFSFPSETYSMISKVCEVLKGTPKEMKKNIPFLVEEEIKKDVEHTQLEWGITGENEDNYKIFFSVMDANLLKDIKRLGTFQHAFRKFESQFLSFHRLSPLGNFGVIDIGLNETRIYYYRDGKPIHVEKVDVGGNILTQSIIREYELNNEEAEIMKMRKGTVEVVEGDELGTVALSTILNQENDILLYSIQQGIVNSQMSLPPEYSPEFFYYNGATFQIRGMVQKCAAFLDVRLETFDFLNQAWLEVEESIDSKEFPVYLSTIALLLIKIDEANEVKLKRLRTKQIQINPNHILISGVALTAILWTGVFTTGLYRDYKIESLTTKLSDKKQENLRLTATRDSINERVFDHERDIQLYSDFIDTIEKLGDKEFYFTRIMMDISRKIPQNVVLGSMEVMHKEKKIIVRGYSPSYTDIGFFGLELEKTGKVEVKRAVKEGGIHTFEIWIYPSQTWMASLR